MKDFVFHEGVIPEGYSIDFEAAIFNRPLHLKLQAPDQWNSFFVLDTSSKHVFARIHFHIQSSVALSPFRSPFGSVEISESIPDQVLFDFILYFEKKLQQQGVSKIRIKHYPDAYNQHASSIVQTFLLNLNYKIVDAELSSVLEVTPMPVSERFNDSAKYRLKKAHNLGCTLVKITSDRVTDVFECIDKWYREKNHILSMDLEHLKRSLESFPDDYLFFGVVLKERLIAASIAIRINSRILYHFAQAHDPAFDKISPVIFLISGVYDYCIGNRMKLLDLGTSALNRQPNFGLLYFKRSLGSTASSKLTFEKML